MQLDLHGIFENGSTIDYEDYEYKEEGISESSSQSMAVAIPVLYSVALLLGLLGNVLVLAVLCRKSTWGVTDGFLLHLSITNLLLLIPMLLWTVDAARGWIFGSALCKVAGALFKICFFNGIFLLTCLSLDRYVFVRHTLQLFSYQKLWVVHLSCVAVWILSLLLSIPDWIYLGSTPGDKPECLHCYPCRASRLTSRLFHHILGFLLPLVVLLYCSIHVLLWCFQDIQKPAFGKRRPAYVILALVLAFLLSWMPYNIALLVDTARRKPAGQICTDHGWTSLKITAILGLLHSCYNPMIYVGFCASFRRWVLNVARCKCRAVIGGDFFPWDCGADAASAQEQQVKDDVL